MGVMVILSALLLAFARSMSVESMAAANRIAAAQADAVEQGAEQWVMANVEEYGNNTNGVDITTQLPAQAIQIGTGYFWLIRPNATSNQEYDFGIQDESSKININSASVAQLQLLPGMTPDIAQAIFDSRTATGSGGAEESYYESLPEPYESKGAKFDTVDELLLVDGVTPQLMYGSDVNRNGVIDPGEQTDGSLAVAFDSAADTSRGIVNFLTVYSRRPAATATSFDTGRINVYTASEQTLMSLTDPNGNPILSQGDADTIIANRANNPEGTSYTQLFNSLTAAQRNLLSPPRGRPLVSAQRRNSWPISLPSPATPGVSNASALSSLFRRSLARPIAPRPQKLSIARILHVPRLAPPAASPRFHAQGPGHSRRLRGHGRDRNELEFDAIGDT